MIAAGQPIFVTLPRDIETRSVLFDPGFIPAPAAALTVITMTPLARELARACGAWTAPDRPSRPRPAPSSWPWPRWSRRWPSRPPRR